jgi:phage baseplate assembly protein V
VDRLLNAWKRQAAQLDSLNAQPRIGLIASVGDDGTTARVRIQPEDVMTGWLPISHHHASNQVGIISPPNTGDQVVLIPHEGDAEQWIIIGRLYSDVDVPPQSPATNKPIAPGEVAIFTPNAWLHFTGGKIFGAATEFNFTGDVNITGNVTATQNISAQQEVTAKSQSGAVHLSTHKHSGVQSGLSQTAQPVPGT